MDPTERDYCVFAAQPVHSGIWDFFLLIMNVTFQSREKEMFHILKYAAVKIKIA